MYRVFLSLLLLCLVSCINDDTEEAIEHVGVGDVVPSFTVTTQDGGVFSTAEHHDRPMVILFFLSTCGDCRQFLPVMEQLWREQQPTPAFDLVAIGREEPESVVGAYWEACGYTMPVAPQEDRRVFSLFATQDVPRVYVVSGDKRIVRAYNPQNLPDIDGLRKDVGG